MPIRPENKDRYPKDWPEISQRIRKRAGNRCEECAVENHALGGRLRDGTFLLAVPLGDNGLRLQWPEPGDLAWCSDGVRADQLRIIRIVLTVAHLDHTPENCADENLKAWCQRCHLRYDAAMKRQGIRERARASAAIGELPI
jgi:hypothetical protein